MTEQRRSRSGRRSFHIVGQNVQSPGRVDLEYRAGPENAQTMKCTRTIPRIHLIS